MDKSFEQLKKQVMTESVLTKNDWQILLQDASDIDSLDGVLIASQKLQRKPPRVTLENILLTALCGGDYNIAKKAHKVLARELTESEKAVILEGSILLGKVQGIVDNITITNKGMLSMLHTAIAISVFSLLKKKRGEPFPKIVNLHTWAKTYEREYSHFNLKPKLTIEALSPISGTFFIFTEESIRTLTGALLGNDIITKVCAEKIHSFSL